MKIRDNVRKSRDHKFASTLDAPRSPNAGMFGEHTDVLNYPEYGADGGGWVVSTDILAD